MTSKLYKENINFILHSRAHILWMVLFSIIISCSENNDKSKEKVLFDFEKPPVIMVCFSWGTAGIGDIGITPGLMNLLEKNIPEAEIIIVANTYGKMRLIDGEGIHVKDYLESKYPKVTVIQTPFSSGKVVAKKDLVEEFEKAFDRADMILYNSGTTLSYGRWGYDFHRSMKLAWPLFMAREAGKPYGIYCQSFDKIAWPANELFVPMLSDADFVFCRDGNSLEYLKSLGVDSPVLEFGPDATFALTVSDKSIANNFMKEHDLKPQQFITITTRAINMETNTPWYSEERGLAHAAKIRKLIEEYIERTDQVVLICPEVVHDIEPHRTMIYDKLPEKTRKNVRFLDEMWLPEEAVAVYSQAETIVSMQMHSIIMALAVGTPVLHPQWWESGRKAWMLKDLGVEEWLFDIDEDPVDDMVNELMEIHNNYDTARNKVKLALDIVHKRQDETMVIVRNTLIDATNDKDK